MLKNLRDEKEEGMEKTRYDLIPMDALELVAQVFTWGAGKHGERDWEEGLWSSEHYGAIMRHLSAYWRGQDLDPEWNIPHLAHVACRALMLLAQEIRGIGTDDRPDEVPPPASLMDTVRPPLARPQAEDYGVSFDPFGDRESDPVVAERVRYAGRD